MGANPASGRRVICENRQARHEYELLDRYSAGLELEGWEVKSLRAKKVQLAGCYVHFRKGQLWLVNAMVVPMESASTFNPPHLQRDRRLLLSRREIQKIGQQIERKGMSCVCVRLYWKGPWAKAEIAVARGKKLHDKRRVERERDLGRMQQRLTLPGKSPR